MRILVVGKNLDTNRSWGHGGFLREIARQHRVTFYGPGHPAVKGRVIEMLESNAFDFILSL
ncbi:unnamed protein product, partial [marine sediment metagenome]